MASTIKIDTITTPDGTGNITVSRPLVLTAGDIVTADIANDAIDSQHYADGSIDEAHIAADAVNFATHLKAGTDGELITWDASGDPAAVAVGTSGHVLTSGGAGVAPTFAVGNEFGTISSTRVMTAATGSVAYTGMGFQPKAICVLHWEQGTANSTMGIGFGVDGDTDFHVASKHVWTSNAWEEGSPGRLLTVYDIAGSPNYQYATVASYDADGLTLAWVKASSPTSTHNLRFIGWK